METLIELRGIRVTNQDYNILQDINLRIPNGKSTFILGPTGSGKSTLLKVIAGLTVPDAGHVAIMGRDYHKMTNHEHRLLRRMAGFVFQDGALWANQSVFNNLFVPLQFHDPDIRHQDASERIKTMLARVGYNDSVQIRPSNLSTGEQKLIAFARSLILEPSLLFLDEPTSFIDETAEKRILGILDEFRKARKTMVAVSNFYNLAFRMADYLCIMDRGKVHCMDTIENVVADWPSFMMPIEAKHQRVLDRRFDTKHEEPKG